MIQEAAVNKYGVYDSQFELFKIIYDNKLGLAFEDLLLEPSMSDIESREIISLETKITPRRSLKIPLVASNMDTISESTMAIALNNLGATGVIHRYMSYEQQISEIKNVAENSSNTSIIAAAVGLKNGVLEHVKNLVNAGCNIIVVDVAHGHHKLVAEIVKAIKDLSLVSPSDNIPVEVIAGNVATPQGVTFLSNAGADCIRVGIGSGSICSTRVVTGHGIPLLTSLISCSIAAAPKGVTIMADGGIYNSGDAVKALAAGANTLMSGSIFAGSNEVPTQAVLINDQLKYPYRGMASAEAQEGYYGNHIKAPEGVSTYVDPKGPVALVLEKYIYGIRSGLSYSGAKNINELRAKASWLRISTASWGESLYVTHGEK